MEANLTGKDFGFKRGHIAVKRNKDIDYYLLLMTEDDYKEIIKALIQVTKQRIRSRERKNEGKKEKKEKKEPKLLSHQAKFKIIADDLSFDEAIIIDNTGERRYKKGTSKKKLFNLISEGITELVEKEKEKESGSESESDNDNSDN